MMRLKNILMSVAAFASMTAAGFSLGNELITNGNFERGDYGQIGWGGHQLEGWNNDGYNFLFNMSNADSTGTGGKYGNVALWGPNKGARNGLTASPVGGNFVGADGAFQTGALSQMVNGLTIGDRYTLSFYWAGAQQWNFNGATTEQWTVKFGTDSFATSVKNDPSHGFTGWQKEMVTFTATGTSELLQFLAVGTPSGQPPFSLLDGVSMTRAVPEPASLALIGLGLGALGFAARRRKSK